MTPGHRGKAAEAVVLTAGIQATVAQLVIVRELMTRFSGNEFVIAVTLFAWLAAGGLGARLAVLGLPAEALRRARGLAAWALAMTVLPTVTLLSIRWLRAQLFAPGTSAGFYPILGFIVLTVAPYSLLAGFLVPRALALLRALRPAATAARVYGLDNVGNVAGGAIFAFVLVWCTTPMTALMSAGAPLLAAAAVLLKSSNVTRRVLAPALAGAGLVLGAGAWVETATVDMGRGRPLFYEETRYGRLTVFQDQGEATLFRDGRPAVTTRDPAGAEAAVHYPLAVVDRPSAVLVVGGSGAMLVELEKYRLDTVDYVEIDPAAVRLQIAAGLMPADASVNRIHQDGRAYLAATGRRYDAIVLAVAEPDTLQLNRYFTESYFQLAADHLRPGGVLSFSVEGYANYIAPVQARKLSILRQTAARCFRHVAVLPGERVFFLCRQDPVPLDIPERLAAKGITTTYAGPYFYGDIDPGRIAALEAALDPAAPVNTDFNPQLIRVMFAAWFAKFATSPTLFALATTVLAAFCLRRMGAAEYVLWTSGAVVMGSEILVIFAFQVIRGYIYHQLGLIVTAFLAGLMPGALLAARRPAWGGRLLVGADAAMILLLAGLAGFLALGGPGRPGVVFVGFGLALSLAAGLQFPAAVRCRGGGLAAAARAFGADLAGAAAGPLMMGLVLIPYGGLFGAIALMMLLKLSSLAAARRCP
ncbi:MAG: hypothetical protein JRF23_04580 [Deltaproteobacteria bacterium]|nr:hypothetical protein [Deltaproteobacteria bacterium]